MLPSMWSIDSLTIPQTGAEEALCWVEKKTLDKKLRFKYIDQNSINNWNKSKKTGREASSSLDQSIPKIRHHTASVCVFRRLYAHVSCKHLKQDWAFLSNQHQGKTTLFQITSKLVDSARIASDVVMKQHRTRGSNKRLVPLGRCLAIQPNLYAFRFQNDDVLSVKGDCAGIHKSR